MTENTQVQDKPVEVGIHMTNLLLAALILLGGILGTSLSSSMDTLNEGVKEVTISVNSLQTSVATASVKFDNLEEDVDDLKVRVHLLEGGP